MEFPKLTGLGLKVELRGFTNLLWFPFLGLLVILSLYFLGLEVVAERHGHTGDVDHQQQDVSSARGLTGAHSLSSSRSLFRDLAFLGQWYASSSGSDFTCRGLKKKFKRLNWQHRSSRTDNAAHTHLAKPFSFSDLTL